MFTANKYGLLYFLIILLSLKKCASELLPPPTPSLVLFSPGDAEYAPVLVRRQGDNVTLRCELRGGGVVSPRRVLWNYLPEGEDYVHLPLQPTGGAAHGSELAKSALRLNDSGAYVCSAPPHSVTKYLLVQPREGPVCARGALVCGTRCVLPTYLCDGRADCTHGEDEAPRLCGTLAPCQAPDRLNCSTGRCIPLAACCRPSTAPALCRQPHCCLEQRAYEMDGFVDVEYPALFEDRHAPDDYSFIQSTIYTVTACALIFMIAVVLLVSAICKMHMKRAQLRSYRPGCSHRALRINSLGGLQLQARFPPCYEASRLLEQRRDRTSPQGSQPTSPDHSQPASPMRVQTVPEYVPPEEQSALGRLGTLFSGRYRQVPTQCSEVELQDVHCGSEPTSLHGSPAVGRPRPTCPTAGPTLGSAEFYFSSAAAAECGRQLNCSSDMYRRSPTLLDLYRRDSLPRPAARPLTLQLGRFQLSIPTFGRRPALATPRDATRRPDTPNIAEINIDDLDFVRLNSNETYTLNGRTIRLLGGEFENYPSEDYPSTEMTLPPPYNEAVRYKLYGPPPHYLSRDALESNGNGNVTVTAEDQATDNVEMPPRYEDLTVSNGGENGLVDVMGNCDDLTVSNGGNTVVENGLVNLTGAASSNDGAEVTVGGIYNFIGSQSDAISGNGICYATETSYDAINNVTTGNNNVMPTDNGNRSPVVTTTNSSNVTNEDVATNGNTVANTGFRASEVAGFAENNGNMTLSAIIDNLPAIDSDVNANDTVILGTCNGETVIENGINVMVDNGN